MGQLLNGEWVTRQALEADEKTGEFRRKASAFRNFIKQDKNAEFPVEANRYHMYVSRACPWAHRTAILRRLKGLEDVISLSLVEPVRINDGWEFSGRYPDPFHNYSYLREVYQQADPNFTGRVTVPVLWDKKKETIVNNESREIVRMLDTVFDSLAENDVTLFPEQLQSEIDETITAIYEPVNNGVYRAGFAGSQKAYEKAVDDLFGALDHWEDVLSEQRYLCGNQLTEADVCMFTTLYRFDTVYHTHFKCNKQRLIDYPNLWEFARDLYQTPGVAETCNMEHIKQHYYKSHPWINPNQLVAVGPELDFQLPHSRERFGGSEKRFFAMDEAA